DLPEPLVSPSERAALRAREGARAAAARSSLAPPVRTLGGAVRALGRAEVASDGRAAGAAQRSIASALESLPSASLADVLALRAYQTESFVAAVRAWEATGTASEDAIELGGGLFTAVVERCAMEGG